MKKIGKKILTIITLILMFAINFNVDSIKFDTNQSLDFNDNIQYSGTGLYEEKKFIPDGGEHFYYSSVGDPIWTYPSSSSYSDDFWGVGANFAVDQNWNPENRYIYDTETQNLGSTDFEEMGVGSIQLDAARRDAIFRTNETDIICYDNEITPNPSPASFSTYYYYKDRRQDPWIYDTTEDYTNDIRNDPTRTYDLVQSTQTITISASQNTWYDEYYYNSLGLDYNRVVVDWDITYNYTTESYMEFYYSDENTGSVPEAYFGVEDITITPIGDLAGQVSPDGASFDNHIDGTITYEIWKKGGASALITPLEKKFQEVDGEFQGDWVVAESTDFGSSLDEDGWYFLKTIVFISHRKEGNLDYDAKYEADVDYSSNFGAEIEISKPYVSISETTPYEFASGEEEILIESDWIDWGIYREIVTTEEAEMRFGYYIPDAIRGYNSGIETLDKGKIIAKIEINKTEEILTIEKNSTETFADVRGANIGFGYGCGEFTWDINENGNELRNALNNSIKFRWKIGVVIESGMELHYDSNAIGEAKSRIYFNNIDFTVLTENKISVSFLIREPAIFGSAIESVINISIFNGEDYFDNPVKDGDYFVFEEMYNATWQIVINKTIPGIGTFTIYNSTYVLDTAFSTNFETIDCNLTNFEFTVKDHSGNPYSDGNVTIFDPDNPSDIRIVDIDGNGNALFEEVYVGDWNILVTTVDDFIVFNNTRTFSYFGTGIEPGMYFMNGTSSALNITADLTNLILNITDSNSIGIHNSQVFIQNIDDPTIFRQGTTNNGDVILNELSSGDWRLIAQSENGHTILNQTYTIDANSKITYDEITYNLTNLELRINDYSGIALGNDVQPFIKLENTNTGEIYTQYAVDGNVTFTELNNSANINDWMILVNVTDQSVVHTVLNCSYNSLITTEDIIYGILQINLTTFELELRDIDNNIIPNALVNFTDGSLTLQQYSDLNGKVLFREMYDTTWELTVNYTVGSSEAILKTNYTIYSSSSYNEVNPTNQEFFLQKTLFGCNLTTLHLWIYDQDEIAEYAGMYQANVTLSYASKSVNISTYLSDGDGYIEMLIPAETYKFTVFYQDVYRRILFNDTGESWGAQDYEKTKTISETNTTALYVEMTDTKVLLSNTDLVFDKPWGGIDEYSQVNTTTGGPPYSISIYYGDSFNLTLLYHLTGGTGITCPTTNWTIYENSEELNNTEGILSGSSSEYITANINSTDYGCGSFDFSITVEQGSFEDAVYDMTIEILNHTTELTRNGTAGIIDVKWGKDLLILLNYTTDIPEVSAIGGAHVSYEIIETAQTGSNLPETGSDTGIYQLDLETWNLNVGSYTIVVNAWQENVKQASLTIYINILALSTETTHEIDSDFKVSTNYLKVAYNENFTMYFNITYVDNSSNVENMNVIAYLNELSNLVTVESLGSGFWQYKCYGNASLYLSGIYTLYITLSKENLINQTIEIDVEILETWGTLLSVIDVPEPTPWGNNASFIVKYYASEDPRNDLLENATISNITIMGTDENVIAVLTADDISLWSWEDLKDVVGYGSGYYNITLNTGFIEIFGNTLFFIIPSIEVTFYNEISTQLYIWINPLSVNMNITSEGLEVNSLILDKGDSQTITVHLQVDEETSSMFGDDISGALIRSTMINVSNNEILSVINLNDVENGNYEFIITAEEVGSYKFILELIFLDNHSLNHETYFTMQVLFAPSTYSILIDEDIRLSALAMKLAMGENINFTLSFDNIDENIPDLDVLMNGVPLDKEIIDGLAGIYRYSSSTTIFEVGNYEIEIKGSTQESNTEEKIIEVEILDFWETTIDIIEPPKVYPWNNISSYIIEYHCIESPRDDVLLDEAEITSLNITYEQFGYEFVAATLITEDINNGIWGWTNLKDDSEYGGGFYEVWFNTSILSILDQQTFYIIPYINQTIYRMASARPYVWITPVETSLTPLDSTDSIYVIESRDLYLDQSLEIFAKLSITDENSIFYGETLKYSHVYYTVFKVIEDTDVEVTRGDLDNLNNGFYKFTFNADDLGRFKIIIESSLTNYSDSQCSFLIDVYKKPIEFETGLNIENDVVFTPQNTELTFSIIVIDPINEVPLTNATVYFVLGGVNYTFTEDSDNPGKYDVVVKTSELKELDPDQSYLITVYISKEDYETTEIPLTFQVGLPVDPILGFAYRYWMIIGASVGLVATIYSTYKYIKYANIPLIVKQIDKTKKLIGGKKSIEISTITLTSLEEIADIFGEEWAELDLNLKDLLGLEKEIPDMESLTSGDTTTGGGQ